MEKLIGSYKAFTPEKYNIFYVLIGTAVMSLFGYFLGSTVPNPVSMIVVMVGIIMVDMFFDYFVFQGVFHKNYVIGILKNSVKGEEVLKLAALGDQLKRLLQYLIIIGVSIIPYRNYFHENGIVTSDLQIVEIALALVLVTYFAITLSFMLTRMNYNFYEGIFAMMITSIISSGIVMGCVFLILRADSEPAIFIILMGILSLGISFMMIERIINVFRLSFGDKKMDRFGKDDKKKMWIFIAAAFGIDYLMIPVMYYGLQKGLDLSTFVAAMMMYPACGVALGKLFSYNEGKIPKAVYVTVIITTVFGMVLSVLSVVAPYTLSLPTGDMDVWYYVLNFVIIICSILLIVFASTCGREKKENGGLRFTKPFTSIEFIFLYIVLFFGRALILNIIDGISAGDIAGGLEAFVGYFTQPKALSIAFAILMNIPFTIIIFFGEEYGWRYYLQPILHKKFGITAGTLILGVVWAVWHIGADFMYYSTESGPQMLVTQCVTCISLAIFMGYAYIKTKNIWVPVMMHLLNNNLVLFLAGDTSTEAMQGNVVEWSAIPWLIIGAIVFWAWIFTPTMLGKKTEKAENTAVSEEA